MAIPCQNFPYVRGFRDAIETKRGRYMLERYWNAFQERFFFSDFVIPISTATKRRESTIRGCSRSWRTRGCSRTSGRRSGGRSRATKPAVFRVRRGGGEPDTLGSPVARRAGIARQKRYFAGGNAVRPLWQKKSANNSD